MKKTLSFLMVMAMLLMTMTGACAQTYTASEKGFGGEVAVTLDIENDAIVNVSIEAAGETAGVGSVAVEKLAAAMVEKNRVDLDAVAGATVTSNAILKAAAQAVAESGAVLTAVETADAPAEAKEAVYTDVLVIGGGPGGLAASIAAVEAGADVVLMEKLSVLGGSAALSGGVFTRASKEGDPEGSMNVDELYNFLMETAENNADPAVVRTFVEKSADTCDWVYNNMVGGYDEASLYPMIPENIVAIHLPGAGAQLMGDMAAYAEKVGVNICLETSATELIEKDGRVVGAVARLADGSTQEFYAEGGVILATGGIANNPEMLAKYSSAGAEKITSYTCAGTMGDGLVMAEKVGASVRFNDEWDTCGAPSGAFTFLEGGLDQGQLMNMMLINDKGERFVNEANIQPVVYSNMRQQLAAGATSFWYISDDNACKDNAWLAEHADGFTVDTLEEIAQKTNIPLDTLKATVDQYNACAGTDNDPLGKPADYNKGMTGPYTVFPVTAIRANTIGGLSITPDGEVLDANGGTIPGLYAAGEVASYNFYYQTYTCGTAIGHAIVYGRIAGTSAASAQ